jgi:hypothetical protein
LYLALCSNAGYAGLAGALLVVPAAAEAQQKVSAKVGVPLKAAQDAIQKKRWDAALGKIKEADGTAGKTAYRPVQDQRDALVRLPAARPQCRCGARARSADCIAPDAGSEKVPRTKTLAQLYSRSGNFAKASQVANEYLKSVPGDKDMQLLVANAAFQQKNYKAAIAAADRIMKGGGTPSPGPPATVPALQLRVERHGGTARALDMLLRYYPSADTWARVLDGFFKVTKSDYELMALYRLAEDVGVLKEARQYTDMTQALVIGGFGMEAERIMQKGIQDNIFAVTR